MADITNIPNTWGSAGPLANAEGWQAKNGSVLLSLDASGSEDRGVRLIDGQAWPFPAGVTVYYRRWAGNPQIARVQTA